MIDGDRDIKAQRRSAVRVALVLGLVAVAIYVLAFVSRM